MTVGSPRPSASFSKTPLKDGVSVSPPSRYWYQQSLLSLTEDKSATETQIQPEIPAEMSFHLLPYDLLLNIASYLEYNDVHVLQLTCKSLYYSFTTRPVYRKLATDLLRRCRPLPLKGFQRLGELSTARLISCVNRAHQYEQAWLVRAPRPTTALTSPEVQNNYLDVDAGGDDALIHKKWYNVVRVPPGEEVDWISPITSSYTLCATKSGKVVCWDVQTDTCLAEWNPGERWELWKCRVEFDEKMVYFTMAKVIQGSNSYDDSRVMEFSLMRLQFYENALGKKTASPTFSPVTSFRTAGVVMNIFLLDPSAKLLSAFVWCSSSNTIGLYVLLDWEQDTYVFIDTGIECVMSSNWSCILFEGNVVIHCEDSDAAFQHFYPLTMLEEHARQLKSKRSTPTLSGRITPFESIVKRFTFPAPKVSAVKKTSTVNVSSVIPITVIDSQTGAIITVTTSISAAPSNSSSSNISMLSSSEPSSPPSGSSNPPVSALQTLHPNPFPFPPWYPESAHFVRQWWPTLPNVPRISCTVVLLASHDPITHKTRFVLAQHYFRVPMHHADWVGFSERGSPGSGPRGVYDVSSDLNATNDDGVSSAGATAAGGSHGGTTPNGSTASEPVGPMEMYFLDGPPEGSVVARLRERERMMSSGGETAAEGSTVIGWQVNGSSDSAGRSGSRKGKGKAHTKNQNTSSGISGDVDADAMKLWYVSDSFEVVCLDESGIDDDEGMQERPRPLVAVDFGHAVWIEYFDPDEGELKRSKRQDSGRGRGHTNENEREFSEPVSEDEENDPGSGSEASTEVDREDAGPERRVNDEVDADTKTAPDEDHKRLRFVTFPPFNDEGVVSDIHGGWGGAEVRTLEIPPELDLHSVETINIDQSQGTIILSVKQGKIFILCYE